MATEASRLAALALVGLVLAAAGCGGSGGARARATTSTVAKAGSQASSFAALRAGPPPREWNVARIPAGGALFYPPGWSLVHGDGGTATAVLLDAHRRIVGYLNLTPRQGNETQADWAGFRLSHNMKEGERNVQGEGTAHGVRFRGATGTCVRDSYTTASRAHYTELACLVTGSRATSVIVGAAAPQAWTRAAPILYRAIAALVT